MFSSVSDSSSLGGLGYNDPTLSRVTATTSSDTISPYVGFSSSETLAFNLAIN